MSTTSSKTILIVDDDIDYLFQLKLQVEKFGFKAVIAESQKEAENLLASFKPDLAIFDLMMENDDSGFILCYKMKRKYPDVPIIIATAVAAETGMTFGISTEQERKWIRADLYLEKGVRPDQLHKEILKLLKL
jgi:two-component system OmpR family response regulator